MYKNWISPYNIPNSSKAFCKWCNVNIRPHKKSLDDHAATDKHLVNANTHNSMPKLIKFVKHPISEQRKIDATLAEWHLVNSKIIADEKESTEDYWSRIDKITTAGEDKRYGHISKLVLALLAFPLSNATVERAFLLVSIIKDKLRNRLAIKSCEAVIRIRYNITQVDLFQPSKSMLNHFTSEEVYASEFQEKILMVIENGAKEQSKEDEEEEEGQDFI